MRTLESKIYTYMAVVSKNKYNDHLDDIIDKYNISYHRRIKVNPADVKSGMYFEYGVEHNDKDP